MLSPDYVGYSADDALSDFRERIKKYQTAYQTLDPKLDREYSWLKVYNVDERYEANKIDGEHLVMAYTYVLPSSCIRCLLLHSAF